ncbi:hypothetical protein HLB23_17725 [Nocardia uniformis]|uniref:Uncharacterized protein n=1 Tax=Nocardia uniformis TaxID=53432 RepID=A0A849C1V9_9NOCA|nr:hypothetical protein [Nocardia uniformis]NNH71678.1 hypothetical protein [Nocardia uniformis]
MSDTSAHSTSRRSGTWLLRIAIGLFAIGLLAIIGIFGWAILSDSEPALWLYLVAMCAPLGFLFGVIFALWSGRRAR